ncbi:MAG: glycosyltransferase family 2 protein [Rhodospirillales bacterium]
MINHRQEKASQEQVTLTIVIPALNEERDLANSVQAAISAAESLHLDFEVLIIDDGSTDATPLIAGELASRDRRIKAISNGRNLGLGGSYKIGIHEARGEYLFWVPADDAHPVAGLVRVLEKLGETDMVIPVPCNDEVRAGPRRFISKSFTFLINRLFKLDLPYYNGLVLHRTALLRGIDIKTNSFAFQAEAIIKLLSQGQGYLTVPYELKSEQRKTDKLFVLKNILAVCLALARLFAELRL